MRQTGRPRSWFGLRSSHPRPRSHAIIGNFFADRCTHLAAMVAYYALLSLLPFLFLLLTLLGAAGEARDTSYLVLQLQKVLPPGTVSSLVDLADELSANAAQVGIIGGIGVLWTSLGFLSALESALNIIYEVPNRAFLRQKAFVVGLVGSTLALLFAALAITTAVSTFVRDHGGDSLGFINGDLLISYAFTAGLTLAFLLAVYRLVPNTRVRTREALPGALFGTVVLQLTFQVLPLYLSFTTNLPTLKAFGGVIVTLVWLFLMCNVVMLGAEINWWFGRGRHQPPQIDEPLGPRPAPRI